MSDSKINSIKIIIVEKDPGFRVYINGRIRELKPNVGLYDFLLLVQVLVDTHSGVDNNFETHYTAIFYDRKVTEDGLHMRSKPEWKYIEKYLL